MRKLLIALTTAGLLSVAGPAFAGPGGTSEGADQHTRCGTGAAGPFGPTQIQVNTEGGPEGGAAVICNDGGPAPIQGRVIASGSTSGGGWVAADGDPDNPEQGKGWTRVDVSAGGPKVRCGGADGGGYNSETPGGGKQEYCG